MARRSKTTGPCADYSEAELAALGKWLVKKVQDTGKAPGVIRAEVEFHGHIYGGGKAIRNFTLELSNAQKARVVAAAKNAASARQEARDTQPKKTYRAKGWRAQFRQLTGTRKGREALGEAGVSANTRTQSRWLSGGEASKGNRAAISRAYEAMRMENVHAATHRADAQAMEAARVFDDVVAEAYGENGVRFRDIQE